MLDLTILFSHSPYRADKDPSDEINWFASVVQAFYAVNAMHDITYRYNFRENTFNFQVCQSFSRP